jgi:hypothetical protein
MKMAEVKTGATYRDNWGRTVKVLEKGLRTDWHRGKPRTSALVVNLGTGETEKLETTHLVEEV